MKEMYQKICQFDLKKLISRRIEQADGLFWSAFWASFGALNLIFIYHGASFLFGDHDWLYLKNGIELDAGLFEGRFSQFLLINLLSQGEILPIINNILGFAGYSLGIALLASYWDLPKKKSYRVIFALFCSITPYILSFMYFAFILAPVLSWNAFIIGGLLISEKERRFDIKKSLAAILLISCALGGYPPVINLIGTVFCVRMMLAVSIENKGLKELYRNYRYTIINIMASFAVFKCCLIYLIKSGAINSAYYNLQITPVAQWGEKAMFVLKDLFLQFGATLPFIPMSYKIAVSLIGLLGVGVIMENKRKVWGMILLTATFLAGLVTLFLSPSIRETEFSPRIDFFGYAYGIAGVLALILRSRLRVIKNLSYVICVVCIIGNAHGLFEAQKVWKAGFDAEMKLYMRVARRFQTDEMFSDYGHYQIVQGGMPSFRSKYYHEKYKYHSDDLLDISYVPTMDAGVMWNYYGIREYANNKSYTYSFIPTKDFLEKLREAEVYPKEKSIAVGANWILMIMSEQGLSMLKRNYLP